LNFNARYQKIKKLLQPKYDPNTYWEKWGRRVRAEDDFSRPHKLEMKMLRVNALLKLLETIQFNSVLDFACGWGFVSKFVLDKFKIDDYVAFDASSNRIAEARLHLKDHSVNLQISMIEDFKTDKKFDLVLGTGILHHVRPENIKPVEQHVSA